MTGGIESENIYWCLCWLICLAYALCCWLSSSFGLVALLSVLLVCGCSVLYWLVDLCFASVPLVWFVLFQSLAPWYVFLTLRL